MIKQWLFWQSEPERWRKWPVTLNFRCIMKSSLLDFCPGGTTWVGQKTPTSLLSVALLLGKFKCDVDEVIRLVIRFVDLQVDDFDPAPKSCPSQWADLSSACVSACVSAAGTFGIFVARLKIHLWPALRRAADHREYFISHERRLWRRPWLSQWVLARQTVRNKHKYVCLLGKCFSFFKLNQSVTISC